MEYDANNLPNWNRKSAVNSHDKRDAFSHAAGQSGSSTSSLILTFPIDSDSLGISVPLILSNSYLRSIQHPALLLNPTGMLRFTAWSSVYNMRYGLK